LAELLKIPRILVHWNVDDARKDGEYALLLLETVFKLNVLVPKGMCEKVESYTRCASLKESRIDVST
jgi:hypothetical protein